MYECFTVYEVFILLASVQIKKQNDHTEFYIHTVIMNTSYLNS